MYALTLCLSKNRQALIDVRSYFYPVDRTAEYIQLVINYKFMLNPFADYDCFDVKSQRNDATVTICLLTIIIYINYISDFNNFTFIQPLYAHIQPLKRIACFYTSLAKHDGGMVFYYMNERMYVCRRQKRGLRHDQICIQLALFE